MNNYILKTICSYKISLLVDSAVIFNDHFVLENISKSRF